ncbi:MAG: hypothetical protein QM729_01190 [Solirubrobacterales bacterium]
MPNIRPALKRSRGRILIGLLTLTATTVALAPATATAAPEKHDLVFKISGQARQNVVGAHGIVITARCPTEACTVVAAASSKSPSIHTGKVRARVAAGGSERLTLPLGKKGGAKLEAALAAGKSPTFTVQITAKDAFGVRVPLSLQVRPSGP